MQDLVAYHVSHFFFILTAPIYFHFGHLWYVLDVLCVFHEITDVISFFFLHILAISALIIKRDTVLSLFSRLVFKTRDLRSACNAVTNFSRAHLTTLKNFFKRVKLFLK